MKLYAITMMKDEEDVADLVLYHLVRQGVDGILVADNMSTDSTPAKLLEAKQKIAAHPDYGHVDVVIVQDDVVAYQQSEKMTQLGHDAAARGATWILPFDADELWFGVGGTLREVLSQAEFEGEHRALAEYWHYGITRDDPPGANPFKRMIYRHAEFTGFQKTTYKYDRRAVLSNGNHSVSYGAVPYFREPTVGRVVMRHYPFRSEEQFVQKIVNGYRACKALAKSADLYGGAGWSPYFPAYEADGIEGLKRLFAEGHHESEGLVLDPAPYEGL